LLVEQGGQLGADPPEALPQVLLPAAQPDAQVPFDADVSAGHDERALPAPDLFRNRQARRVRVVPHQRNRARGRRRPLETTAECLSPFLRDRQVMAQDLAGARITALAVGRLDGYAREAI